MIVRKRHISRIGRLFESHPVVAILGARQVGKTTLAAQFADETKLATRRFDLEDPADLAQLDEPILALRSLDGLVVIDEIQRRPDLFPTLRVLVDRPANNARFLVLGSASTDLIRQSSETLAGRIAYHELPGFTLDDVGISERERLWLRGGFPRAFLALNEETSSDWRSEFIRTFLERDVAQLGIQIPSLTLHRFWSMLAHYHGQIWNGAEFGRAFGVAATTVRRYLDLLSATLVVRQLQPWHENIKKRQVRSPKVYLTDSGLLHSLLGLKTREDLCRHPKVGASWEGYVMGELVARLDARREDCYFWASYTGAELDLLVVRGQQRVGFEIKRTTSPKVTKSTVAAVEHLDLQRVDVVHAGDNTFPLAEGIRAVALSRLLEDVEPLR